MPRDERLEFITPEWLLEQHKDAMGGVVKDYSPLKLKEITDSLDSGIVFYPEMIPHLEEDKPLHIAAYLAREVVSRQVFSEGNHRTAVKVFLAVQEKLKQPYDPTSLLKHVLSIMSDLEGTELITFILNWPYRIQVIPFEEPQDDPEDDPEDDSEVTCERSMA